MQAARWERQGRVAAGDQLGGLALPQARGRGASDQGRSSRPGGIRRRSPGNLLMDLQERSHS